MENLITPKEEDHKYSGFKRFYKFIKHKKTDFNGVAPLKVDGKLVTKPKDKAEALNHQFQSVFSHETVMPTDNESSHQQVPSMPSINITAPGVLKLLKGLNPNKASGPDNISPRTLRELSDELASPFTTIFQHSLQQGVVPEDWRRANVAPVFKKGQKYLSSNYRPISLTCIISKLMEHIINSSIIAHARSHNIPYPLQHGFRAQRSCETQLLDFVNDIANNMQAGLQTDVCVLDFAKAFDKVSHQRLVHKLRWYGIDGPTNRWISSFLSDRKQRVVVEGVASGEVAVTSGCRRGQCLALASFSFT